MADFIRRAVESRRAATIAPIPAPVVQVPAEAVEPSPSKLRVDSFSVKKFPSKVLKRSGPPVSPAKVSRSLSAVGEKQLIASAIPQLSPHEVEFPNREMLDSPMGAQGTKRSRTFMNASLPSTQTFLRQALAGLSPTQRLGEPPVPDENALASTQRISHLRKTGHLDLLSSFGDTREYNSDDEDFPDRLQSDGVLITKSKLNAAVDYGDEKYPKAVSTMSLKSKDSASSSMESSVLPTIKVGSPTALVAEVDYEWKSPVAVGWKTPRKSSAGLLAQAELQKQKLIDAANAAEHAFQEIIETEKVYLKRLEDLEMHYRREFVALTEVLPASDWILTEKEIEQVFLNLPELIDLSQQLLKELKDIRREGFTYNALAQIFVDHEKKITTIFATYSVRYEEMQKRLDHLLQTNSKFAKFVQVHSHLLGRSLQSVQIEPVQRVMRYLLLMKECSTDEKDEFGGVECVQRICSKVDEKVDERIGQRMTCILQQNLFKGKVSLIDQEHKRRCLRVGILTKTFASARRYSLRSNNSRQYLFMLFNDCLGYAELSKDGRSARLRHLLPLGGMRVRRDSDPENACTLINSCKKITVVGSTDVEIDEWVTDIKNAVKELEESYRRSGGLLPVADQLTKVALMPPTGVSSWINEFVFYPDEAPWLVPGDHEFSKH